MDIKIRGANIEFECDFEPFPGDFAIDVSMVRAAFVNILENAMEACIEDKEDKDHKIVFRVGADGDFIRFDFIDNGPGMSAEDVKKIFAMFYSSKGSRGTGLGLFVTRKIIRKHGGTITLESKPGRGAHFQVRLPRKPREKKSILWDKNDRFSEDSAIA
jgi:signal transduction histidine kinase